MALTERVVVIANKGHRKGTTMAKRRKMSAKQIRIFGTKAQKSALKRKRSPRAKSHRPRTVKRNAPKRRQTAVAKRRKTSTAYVPRRKNLGGIFALTNPAKGHKTVAKTKAKTHRRAMNAGTKRTTRRVNKATHRAKRRNPGTFGTPKDWLFGGVGVLAGVIGTRALPQMVLGSANVGATGYLANAASAAALTFAAHMVSKDRVLSASVLAGGVASIISRLIQDYSLLGSYSSQVGLGDYLMSDFLTPQLVASGLQNAQLNKPSWGAVPAAIPANVQGASAGVAGITGPALY